MTSAQVVETLVTTTDSSMSRTTLLQNYYCTSNDILTAEEKNDFRNS